MKKNGFTLAEVLITLAIIGVVATLTLPALMTNTAEQQYKAALKKVVNTLTEAAQLNQAISGFDFGSLTSSNTKDNEAQSLYGLLATRTAMDFQRSGDNKTLTSNQGGKEGSNTIPADNYVVYFKDGSYITFPSDVTSTSAITTGETGDASDNGTMAQIMDDGLPYGIPILFDANGAKAPNVLSNCTGAATGALTANSHGTESALCDNKNNRVIKDQFALRLRGSFAVPNSPAAKWAFEN